MRKSVAVILYGVGLGLAVTVGASAGAATAEPETITETVTETETIEVEVTPESCIIALDAGAEAIKSAAEYAALIPEAAEAGFNRNAAEIDVVTGKISDITAEIETTRGELGDSATYCRAAAVTQ